MTTNQMSQPDRVIRYHLEKAQTEIRRVTEPNSAGSIQLALQELHDAIALVATRAGVADFDYRRR
ncbi:hypothetical protein [Cellulosimicrobium aquatile]|uniref:hypothetical protein n=1 Tax=Cellulosimicrobium aquatile TaxID=1612203 RepID=UPI0014598AA5|nr:hypothetical protein [Cellulosimicrobium aquatile]NMF29614.1 hypothetical protein [Cellulosimicrobium aquatile]